MAFDHYVIFLNTFFKDMGMSTRKQKIYRNEGQDVQRNEYEFMEGVVGL